VAVYFFDSSALVKRYVNETGTPWVLSLVGPGSGHSLYVARITGVEIASAIARQARSGALVAADAAGAMSRLRHDLSHEYRVVEIGPTLISDAMSLAETRALRAYDAVQLPATLPLKTRCDALGLALTLVRADLALNAAAVLEGLTVEDPNSHP
jgi:predicted nucleic acid-binding protein